MIGATLGDIRDHIESLASESGAYYLVCARTGDRPVPATDLRFETRATARLAATATEQYRAALRRYDPRLPWYDVVVCQAASEGDAHVLRPPVVTLEDECGSTPDVSSDDGSPIDFCHTVAGAVFETIAASPHASLEDAIMDAYLATAETVEDPDELCLRLLESVATELDDRLDAGEQAALLRAAAARLSTPDGVHPGRDDPVDAALDALRSAGLVAAFSVDRSGVDGDAGRRSWTVTLDGYALGAADDVVTLPLVVELFRRCSPGALRITGAERLSEGDATAWRFEVETAENERPCGLVTAPRPG